MSTVRPSASVSVATEVSLIVTLFVLEAALYGAGWLVTSVAVQHPTTRSLTALGLIMAAAVILPWVWAWFYTRVEVIIVDPAE